MQLVQYYFAIKYQEFKEIKISFNDNFNILEIKFNINILITFIHKLVNEKM